MNYYKRHIGDYAKKAGRLSMLQHGAYTLLIDACYDRERFPTESEAMEWTWASTPEEEQAVRFVLSRFFNLQDDGTYIQSRVLEELQCYKIGEVQNRLIALSREARKQKRKEFSEACDQLRADIKNDPLSKSHDAWTCVVDALIKSHEAPPNQEPLTTNHKPVKKSKEKRFSPPTIDEVKNYQVERNSSVDPERFIDFYESKGWLVGKNKMKDWKAAFRNWEKRDEQTNKGSSNSGVSKAAASQIAALDRIKNM